MSMIHALYESGAFRPTVPIDLSESSEVKIDPSLVASSSGEGTGRHLPPFSKPTFESRENAVAARQI